MKHIKKRFHKELTLTQAAEAYPEINWQQTTDKKRQNAKMSLGDRAFFITDDNRIFEAFPYAYNGIDYLVPEPDPTLIYFNNAYFSYTGILKNKKEIPEKLDLEDMDESVKGFLYVLFGNCFGFATMLITAMEAYINNSIPSDYKFRFKNKDRDKAGIERWVDFRTKCDEVLKGITGKDFKSYYKEKYEYIINLKEFRDNIMHTKTGKEGNTPYDYLYKKALNFEYEETIEAVRDWLNYYAGYDYVTECDCGKDY